MVLSEAEAEARLAALRREREALDRAIADLTLYLELGRRLTAGAAAPASRAWGPSDAPSHPRPRPEGPEPAFEPAGAAPRDEGEDGRGRTAPHTDAGPQAADGDDAAALSETVLARRHGRAVIAAALAVLEEAGRPLHASEIQAALAARGYALPGSDPVAALNTRLWKRSGPGGPLRRLGEAVYALAEADAAP